MKFDYDKAYSPAGKAIRDHMEAELKSLREENDWPTKEERETCFLRGRIKQLKDLIEAVTYTPPPE